MRLIRYFSKKYPLQTTLMVLCLWFAALADGIGMTSILGLLSMAEHLPTDGSAFEGRNTLESAFITFYGWIGVTPSIRALLVTIVAAFWSRAVLTMFARRQVGFTVARSACDLRIDLLEALMSTRWRYFIHEPIGSVASAMTSEAGRASASYLHAATVLSQVIQSALYMTLAVAMSWQVTAVSFIVAGAGLLLLRRFMEISRKAGMRQTRVMRQLLGHVSDTLQALKPLKAMSRERRISPIIEEDALKLNRVARKQVMASEGLSALQEPLVGTILVGGAGICLLKFGMDFKMVVGIGFVLARVLLGLAKAQRQYQKYVTEVSAFWAILGMIDDARSQREELIQGEKPSLRDAIRLRGISLAYDDNQVLDEVDVDIPAGQITALIGPSGAGKSTLTDIVIGLIRPDRGEVHFDDVPMDKVDTRLWRESIGYVPQELFLLNNTIRANVSLGEEAIGDEQIEQALRRADAWEFISRLPEGLDTMVGERGARLSGGQRQRISIARALVHNPSLLILDEATASLDPQTEKAVWESLCKLRGEVTILAVSHQPHLAKVADRIYRVDDGDVHLEERTASASV